MTALFVTVLLASLLGSLHCAGMCGAFVAFAIGAGDPAVKVSRNVLMGLYHAGRLLTYVTLGAIAGTLGAGIDLGGQMVGLQRAAAILSGTMMVGFGAITLMRLSGIKLAHARVPARWTAFVSSVNRSAMRYSPSVRAVATGLLTTLLPCGWLYAFVITAAGTRIKFVLLEAKPTVTLAATGALTCTVPCTVPWPLVAVAGSKTCRVAVSLSKMAMLALPVPAPGAMAVIVAICVPSKTPSSRIVKSNTALLCPAEIVTLAGTTTCAGSLEVSPMTTSAVCAAGN